MSRQRYSGRKRRPRDTMAAEINLTSSIGTSLKGYAKLDSGNGGTEFPDGQVLTGNQYLHDTLTQESNYIWIQDSDTFDFGGLIVLDYDIQSGTPPVASEVVSVFGLGESQSQPGTKVAGVVFVNPLYPNAISTAYSGSVRFQSLNIPYNPASPRYFGWPADDGAPGATLTTNGSGGLYWTDPTDPPDLITDVDQTDYAVAESPGNLAPVSVTATRAALPGEAAFECTFSTGSNNRTVTVELLVNGVQEGTIYTTPLPRGVDTFVHHTWSPLLPLGTETLTIRHTANDSDVSVLGTVTDTRLGLLIPSAATVQSAYSQGSSYIISPQEFWGRWSNTALEKLAKLLNRQNIMGGPPSWLNVARAQIFVSFYSAQNINLLDQNTIDNVQELVTLNVLSPAEATVILAT